MDRLKEIDELIKQKQDKVCKLRVELLALEIEKQELKTGFKNGEVVLYKGMKGKLIYSNSYWWKFSAYKKNGELSSISIHVYDEKDLEHIATYQDYDFEEIT